MSDDEPANDSRGYLFVDEELRFLTGEEARLALERKSDSAYLRSDEGVTRVPRERWNLAQKYESRTWSVAGAHAIEDRNHDHARGFGDYGVLHGRRFRSALEIGCGPFTNLRLIAGRCRVEQCTLLDPLIAQYLQHRHCAYSREFLKIAEKPLWSRLGGSRLARGLRRLLRVTVPSSLFERIPVREVLACPVEEMPPRSGYDLVIMINVIEHCFDIDRIFGMIEHLIAEGGVFIFHDKLLDHDTVAREVVRHFDAGHPLRVDRRVIQRFLGRRFSPLFESRSRRTEQFEGTDLSTDEIYFIGQRL